MDLSLLDLTFPHVFTKLGEKDSFHSSLHSENYFDPVF